MKWIIHMALILLFACNGNAQKPEYMTNNDSGSVEKIVKTEEEWQEELTPEQFYILREKGTERPFTGKYDKFYEKGHYECAACELFLFDSESKFSSGCGWPSFSDVAKAKNLQYHKDTSHGMIRTEVTCARCGGHLGHVFEDGPPPTGLRYCINSVAIQFIPENKNNSDQ